MDGFFGIGIGELILVAIVALIVLGPERLPGTFREVAKFIRSVRNLTREFTDQFGDEFKALEDLDPRRMLQDAIKDIDEEEKAKEEATKPAAKKSTTSSTKPTTAKSATTKSTTTKPTTAKPTTTKPASTSAKAKTSETPEKNTATDGSDSVAGAENGAVEPQIAPPELAAKAEEQGDNTMSVGGSTASVADEAVTTPTPASKPVTQTNGHVGHVARAGEKGSVGAEKVTSSANETAVNEVAGASTD
ncbi:MAG: twin-arginine translocase subunit TatB, partial [Caldilineaceae bacterium]|nr:twin-arginine translocase subunit TatB [Caldilineaceae bacterium]